MHAFTRPMCVALRLRGRRLTSSDCTMDMITLSRSHPMAATHKLLFVLTGIKVPITSLITKLFKADGGMGVSAVVSVPVVSVCGAVVGTEWYSERLSLLPLLQLLKVIGAGMTAVVFVSLSKASIGRILVVGRGVGTCVRKHLALAPSLTSGEPLLASWCVPLLAERPACVDTDELLQRTNCALLT